MKRCRVLLKRRVVLEKERETGKRSGRTMQLLADRLVELGVMVRVSDETVRTTLKKMNSNRG